MPGGIYSIEAHMQKIDRYEGKPAFVALILDITEQKRRIGTLERDLGERG